MAKIPKQTTKATRTTFSQRNKGTVYYAMHDDGLRNGSFLRRGKYGLAQFMNGDFMGFIPAVLPGFSEVDKKHAENLIPRVCGGNGKGGMY